MRKVFLILMLLLCIDVYASNGILKQKSIIECNGEYYGNHANPLHWHKAKLVGDKWVSDGDIVSIPPCYIKPINTFEDVSFSKCIDGDTAKFFINNEEKTVRFLAINTPEVESNLKKSEPYGKEASDFTCKSLKKAKKITLEYDSNSEKEDKYGRILAFVYVDDILLESKLIENGYAKVDYIYGDYAHVDKLKEIEKIAQDKKIGIWSLDDNLPDIIEKEENNNQIFEIIEVIIEYLFKIISFVINKVFA